LAQAANGGFYGTTLTGGANDQGTIFKITPAGALTAIYSFCAQTGCRDGAKPLGALIQATNGDLYGMTSEGGTGYGMGFKVTPTGTLTALHSFDGKGGYGPQGSLTLGTGGNFYGVTYFGGLSTSFGTIFQMTPAGKLTTLEVLSAAGKWPAAALLQGTDGSFYGTTSAGPKGNAGTVFNLGTGLGPFVATVPAAGKSGSSVTILGTDLTGASSVTFNGAAASFMVVSATEITAAVPTGATTGNVQVVTPGGTLTSNAAFRVPR
jgi:uncharacterized repeat protein (TIGR03803 family)